MTLNPEKIRQDIPILLEKNAPIYFDNACMTLRPRQVIEKITEYYQNYPACSGRSTHNLSKKVDEEVYKARKTVQKFINAKKDREIIFLRNTTEGINLVARSFDFKKGDVILVSDKEHNSNLLPWQVIARKKGLTLDIVESQEDNTFSIGNFESKLEEHGKKVRLISLGLTSNLDGVTVPAKEIIKTAHRRGIKVMLDAAQGAPHSEIDVKGLDVDFLAFSGHKMMGPTGIGVLYGKEEELKRLSSDNVGGETVYDSTFKDAKWEDIPHKFEAGLQHYAGIIGLGEAINYVRKIGLKNIHKHEVMLNERLTAGLEKIEGFSLIGPRDAKQRGGICSFNIEGVNPHDLAEMINASSNISIRSGAHCVHSWFNKHNLNGSARASLYAYNTTQEVDRFISAVKEAVDTMR